MPKTSQNRSSSEVWLDVSLFDLAWLGEKEFITRADMLAALHGELTPRVLALLCIAPQLKPSPPRR
jgi:hypothetical protein